MLRTIFASKITENGFVSSAAHDFLPNVRVTLKIFFQGPHNSANKNNANLLFIINIIVNNKISSLSI